MSAVRAKADVTLRRQDCGGPSSGPSFSVLMVSDECLPESQSRDGTPRSRSASSQDDTLIPVLSKRFVRFRKVSNAYRQTIRLIRLLLWSVHNTVLESLSGHCEMRFFTFSCRRNFSSRVNTANPTSDSQSTGLLNHLTVKPSSFASPRKSDEAFR